MTCTTILHDWELNVPTSDDELNNILEEARRLTGRNWQVIETVRTTGALWWKEKVYGYSVYVEVPGVFNWQQIISASGNLFVARAYFFGVIAGTTEATRVLKKCLSSSK